MQDSLFTTPDLGQRIKTALLDLLFPPRCIGCGRVGSWFCEECCAQIEPIRPPLCPLCGRPSSGGRLCFLCRRDPLRIDGIRAVAYLEGTLREAIHRFKYDNLQDLVFPLARLLNAYLQSDPLPVDVIVPVPLHPKRLRERGYNQSALLARRLGDQTGLPVSEGSLFRVRETVPQVALNARQRRENVKGAFACADERLAGKRVLLIDDVCTTGATLEACSIALAERKARSVWALVLARER